MRKFKIILNGYLVCIGEGMSGIEISDDEYSTLYALMRDKPEAPEGYEYRINEQNEYKLVEVEPLPEPEPDDSDYAAVGKIFMGVIE